MAVQVSSKPISYFKKMGYSKEDYQFMRIGRMYSVYIKSSINSENSGHKTNQLRILPEDLV